MATKIDQSLALVYEDMRIKFIPEKIYEQYTEDNSLFTFNILHLHKGKLCLDLDQKTNNPDACKFTLWGFNTSLDLRKNLGEFEFIELDRGARADTIFIYADGSTFISFKKAVKVEQIGRKALVVWM